jgi:uncharacterized protein YndB with AHSA1/START domain
MTTSIGLIGSMRRLDEERAAVRMEDVYATDAADLWSALTEPDRLARWIGNVEGDLRVGGVLSVRLTSSFEGAGTIDVCDAPHRLVVRLEPDTADETEIEAVLTPAGDGTRLVVEERGLPVETIEGYGAGWQTHVEDLATYLSGGEPGPWRERWQQLKPAYAERGADLRAGG